MSWLSRVRSGIPFLPKRQSAENLWHKCSKCGTMVFLKEWEENYGVCPRCEFHDRIGPRARFEQLFDAAKYEILPAPEVREDPLRFKDSKRYTERLKAARSATNERDALINARGRIDGHKVVVGVQDFAFMGGSMGVAVGAAFVAGVRAAIADHSPYIIFTASGGARMQEAVLSLMQLPRTIREKLPEGFQRAEYLLEHGIIDMVVPRAELKARLALLVGYLCPEAKAAA